MLLDFLLGPIRTRPSLPTSPPRVLQIGTRTVPLCLVRNYRARRYILRVQPDGSTRVTIPPHGSIAEGVAFAQRHVAWIESQLQKRRAAPVEPKEWFAGTEILFRGERVLLRAGREGDDHYVEFADQRVRLSRAEDDLRGHVERRFWELAVAELVPRTLALAAEHRLTVHRVVVRNQRSRWGSCSARKTISLNWRLIQTPPLVSDYILVHELMHLREMNHSARFWSHVAQACPPWREAEEWLRQHGKLLR